MKDMRSLRAGTVVLPLAAVLLAGCASDEVAPANQPPTVELTTAPLQGQVVSYSIDIGWEGTDPDGVIERYEYAVDPPPAFTEEEIASGGEGIQSEVIPGGGSGPDVTRITKVVDGSPVSFDWVHTVATSHHFIFQTANAESVSSGGNPVPSGRFTGMHAVYVRAVDDDQAVSVPDHVAFTAESVAPEAVLTRPAVTAEALILGTHPIVEWTGTDPDGPAPVGYLTRLLRLDTLDPPRNVLTATANLLFKVEGAWTYRDAGDPALELDLQSGGQYLFGVRAVDEAGAEEPFLNLGRNVFRCQAFENAANPTLTLDCLSGDYSFRGDGIPVQVQVPAGQDLQCEVTCTAEQYGETCADLRWGLDVVDLDTDEGWTPWSTDFVLGPISVDAGVHVLYVEARDSLGHITLATLILDSVEFTFDREALWVDDSNDDLYPRDSEHDAFWQARFDAYPGFASGDVFEYQVFGDNDRASIHPQVPGLNEFGRYKMLIWDTRGTGFDGETGLVKSIIRNTLQQYLAAGGKLWLLGRLNLGATVPDAAMLRGDLVYPKELAPGDFAWDFLKLHTTKVNDDKGTDTRNNLYKVRPFPGRPAVYDSMAVDPVKQNEGLSGLGIPFADAVFDPILDHQEPGFAGVLDSLYVYAATGNEIQGKNSAYHNRLVAVRWHDPDPARAQGRIQWFGFPMYYFNDAEAQETLNRSLDWFREETPPAP